MTTKNKYPEHEKLKAVAERSQTVGSFLDWLTHEKGIALTVQHEHTASCKEHGERYNNCGYREGEYMHAGTPVRVLLAEFFEIDEKKIEAEKQAMLAELRGESLAQQTGSAP